jgi:hypothetical protein
MTAQKTDMMQNIGVPMAEAFLTNYPRSLPLARYIQLIGPQFATQGVPYNPSLLLIRASGIFFFSGRVLQTIYEKLYPMKPATPSPGKR